MVERYISYTLRYSNLIAQEGFENVNKIIVIGHLGRDPEMRYTPTARVQEESYGGLGSDPE